MIRIPSMARHLSERKIQKAERKGASNSGEGREKEKFNNCFQSSRGVLPFLKSEEAVAACTDPTYVLNIGGLLPILFPFPFLFLLVKFGFVSWGSPPPLPPSYVGGNDLNEEGEEKYSNLQPATSTRARPKTGCQEKRINGETQKKEHLQVWA